MDLVFDEVCLAAGGVVGANVSLHEIARHLPFTVESYALGTFADYGSGGERGACFHDGPSPRLTMGLLSVSGLVSSVEISYGGLTWRLWRMQI